MTIKKIFLISSMFLCTATQYVQTMFFALTAGGVNETDCSKDAGYVETCCNEFCCDVCTVTVAAILTVLFSSSSKDSFSQENKTQACFKKIE